MQTGSVTAIGQVPWILAPRLDKTCRFEHMPAHSPSWPVGQEGGTVSYRLPGRRSAPPLIYTCSCRANTYRFPSTR
uniref:Uncharacterized protein n=1 Tax=mine drainage metagenome TaxID=410659 RepID=E6QCN8_9ZZZZ